MECRHLLSPFQLGFRKGKETADAGWRLTHDVVEALQTRHQVQVVAMDIQSTYDTVWHAGLLTKMKDMGIDEYLIRWIRSFLHRRQRILGVGMARQEVYLDCGVPQGSPLSCTLFLIYLNDLLQDLILS